MSAKTGDKARFHRVKKRKAIRRAAMRKLRAGLSTPVPAVPTIAPAA